jgi:pimeloyl-ACP methyl ester carboxylesterase
LRGVLVCALAAAGCVTTVAQQCPRCVVVDAQHAMPRPRAAAERLFLLVPGALGYGWEWDAAVARLEKAARVQFMVFWWDPWRSLARAADDLGAVLTRLIGAAPPSLREIVVVAHSAGGMVGAHALAGLRVPPGRRVTLVTIGTPFAGMMAGPFTVTVDPLYTPAILAIGGIFTRYPDPPPGVEVIEYVTSYPPDPVMEPRWGHFPAPPDIGPRGAIRRPVEPTLDHNHVVEKVISDLLAR